MRPVLEGRSVASVRLPLRPSLPRLRHPLELRPTLLLMDEPLMGLAPILVERIFDTLRQITQEGITCTLVELNAHMALPIAHRIFALQTGQIVLARPTEELRKDPMAQQAYLVIE